MTEVLDTDQTCEYLKIAKPTLYKYARSGKIPAYKMGRVWKFHKNTLEKWLQACIKEDTELRKGE